MDERGARQRRAALGSARRQRLTCRPLTPRAAASARELRAAQSRGATGNRQPGTSWPGACKATLPRTLPPPATRTSGGTGESTPPPNFDP